MVRLIEEFKTQAEVVLFNTLPILTVCDAMVLASRVDGTMLVLEAGHTRREAAWRAVESLRQVGANLVGVVLKAVPNHKGSYY